jgi:arylsulfatase A-like enzyme
MIYGRMEPTDEAMWRRYQSYYFNCIRDVDRNTGTVLDQLKANGLADNTIIVYVSDHGEMAGAQKLRQKGPHMFKENMRVPLIVSHPDARRGGTTDALASPIDIIPMLLGFAGVDTATRETLYPYLKGIDVAASVADPAARGLRDKMGILYNYGVAHYWDPVFVEKAIEKQSTADKLFLVRQVINNGMFFPSLDNPGLFRGVYDGRYKFARYFKPAQHHKPRDFETLVKYNELELFDTKTDPNELNNLALKPEAVREPLMRLSDMTNALADREVGPDDGAEHLGPRNWYKLHDKLPGSRT